MLFLRRAPMGQCYWSQSTDIASKEDLVAEREHQSREKLRLFIIERGSVTLQQLKDNAAGIGYAVNSIFDAATALSEESLNSDELIYHYKKGTGGCPANVFTTAERFV